MLLHYIKRDAMLESFLTNVCILATGNSFTSSPITDMERRILGAFPKLNTVLVKGLKPSGGPAGSGQREEQDGAAIFT
ncbi:hypothetical protein JOQ06_020412 [Pogonophryne albipinna]|uniref:Uncharacterized protein n=1 Tax=Pogonophryne albipinna TaxID=1090488 RepID=A0AAD6FUH7_9TELE|nr:hypothetical protein JOQ06_020412 [Pogonophryne albipinna]